MRVKGLLLLIPPGPSDEGVEPVGVSINYPVVQVEKVLFPFSGRIALVLTRITSLFLGLCKAV